MENLFLRLEQLLGDFVAGFLNRLLESEEFHRLRTLPREFNGEYLEYLRQFQSMQTKLEQFAAETEEDALQRNRALALLKSSSKSIISTFYLGDH